jgi:ATP-dependent DNA ligase
MQVTMPKPMCGGRSAQLRDMLEADHAWMCQAKIDGHRTLWDGTKLLSRRGHRVRHPLIEDALRGCPPIDGELWDCALWAFDLPDHPGTLDERWEELGKLEMSDAVKMVPTTRWAEVMRSPWEGAVYKRRSSLYPTGCSTSAWVKFRK